MIKATNITKSFGDLQVLKGINIEVEQGEFASIVGTSGAGKTTLLQILGTLSAYDSGQISINNTSIDSLNENQMAEFRNQNIGFVFQFHHLLPEFTALENVCIPAFIGKVDKDEAILRANKLLRYLHIDHRLNHKPNELSGGEKQRVAIARALINNPSVIFADEPTGNLDSRNTQELYELFISLKKEFKQTFIIVTHNLTMAKKADKVFTIKDGEIINA